MFRKIKNPQSYIRYFTILATFPSRENSEQNKIMCAVYTGAEENGSKSMYFCP